MAVRRLRFWGWGYEDEPIDAAEAARVVQHVQRRLAAPDLEEDPAPRLEDIELSAPRLSPPASLRDICDTAPIERVSHTYGKSFPDYVRTLSRDFSVAPDVVAYPRHEADIVDLLAWASDTHAAVIPFGAGSSVVGGVEAAVGDGYRGVITIDLRQLDQVLEVDETSRAARIQGGVLGPHMDAQLKPHGFSMRHFPQSYQFSTLGGWIATRSGGHYASLYTHIDDFVESLRVVTPAGVIESRRLPGSGAGPSPDRFFIGSEGTLGVITEAWMRVQNRPTHKAAASMWFYEYQQASRAVRAIAQAGLYPSNCRLIDADETAMTLAGDGSRHLLVLGFESGDHPVDAWMARAIECCQDFGGVRDDSEAAGQSTGAGGWRTAFIRAPFYRSHLIARGIIHDTFETSIPWDHFPEFHARVKTATAQAIHDVTGRDGTVTCRFTHVYPDGPAPYFTFHAVGKKGALLEQWRDLKQIASDILLKEGGTITHHHAVGRDHRPWYDQQRPDLFADAVQAAKTKLDPKGVLNPGVLIDPA